MLQKYIIAQLSGTTLDLGLNVYFSFEIWSCSVREVKSSAIIYAYYYIYCKYIVVLHKNKYNNFLATRTKL